MSGLYDHHAATQSIHSLKLLISVKEPHDRLLCDRLAEGLRSSSGRAVALDMLGYIVRKQPTWLHKVAQHPVFLHLLKLLRTETDLSVVVPGLLVLLSLLPAVSAKLGHHLAELFEVFGRLAVFSWREGAALPLLSGQHLRVALYAFFHRLYGMFPCNFLSWLRTQYPESNQAAGTVFTEVISPILASVKLHPLLVTQSRDQERTPARWRGLAEVHEVVAECSRYCLDTGQCCPQDCSALPDLSSEPRPRLRLSLGRQVLDSPPEAAVEATPDNTPYDTPVKDPSRPPGPPHIRSLSFGRSPGPPASPARITPGADCSPFKWPEVGGSGGRGEEYGQLQELPPHMMGKRDSLGLGLVLPRGLREAEEGRSREGRFSGGDTDAEVSELTSSEEPRSLLPSSRRVTPHLQESPRPPPSLTLSPPASVEELVRAVRTRVRCITLCEQEGVASPSRHLARAASCPSLSLQVLGAGAGPCRESRDRTKLRFTSATQTDSGLALLPYEYLFPFALPAPQTAPPPPARPDPYSALDSYIRYSVESLAVGAPPPSAAVEGKGEGGRALQSQLRLLHSHLQWEVSLL